MKVTRWSLGRTARLVVYLIAVSLSSLAGGYAPALAQSGSGNQQMTLEQLEAFVAQQREALEKAREEREAHRLQWEKVQEQLAAQQLKVETLQQQLEVLCEEHNELAVDGEDPCDDNGS